MSVIIEPITFHAPFWFYMIHALYKAIIQNDQVKFNHLLNAQLILS